MGQMDFYTYNFLFFVFLNGALSYRQLSKSRGLWGDWRGYVPLKKVEAHQASNTTFSDFKKKFLLVYLLVFAADWLQGPYIYTLYKDEKGLSETTVAHLFTTGFLAGAISATFVGSLADLHGRRLACQGFCIAYSACCLSILFDNIFVLFVGRILGGLSTTLLYSVFESWLVTEYHRQHLDEVGGSLKDIFGLMTTLNSVVAIVAGLAAQGVADLAGTQKAPFMTAVGCLVLASLAISNSWEENYGHLINLEKEPNQPEHADISGFKAMKRDKRLWALTITSCFFEGSLFLWIFFKFPALRLSHQLAGKGSDLPFGMIFANLMCAMMLGSRFFTWYSAQPPGGWIVSSAEMLAITQLVASCCFVIPTLVRNEAVTFWCFCIFEMCCGVYFPTMGNMKEKIVDDEVRAKIYGVLRLPLNLFVVVGLGLTQDGEKHRDNMFIICSIALAIAGGAVRLLLGD